MDITSMLHSLFTRDLDKNILVQSNYLSWSIIFSYIMFTKVIGPNLMKNRKPMELKYLILFYNFALVFSNIYLCYTTTSKLIQLWPHRCNILESPLFEEKKELFTVAWGVFLVKFAELLDTVFFILRKKFNQVSFLHVFHHSIVCILFWIMLRFKMYGYYEFVIGSINTGVHVLLYLYYALSALGPEVRKHLWWKKYLTSLQIAQFFVLMSYMAFSFITGCEEFGKFEKAVFGGLIAVTLLFLNFYRKTYAAKKIK